MNGLGSCSRSCFFGVSDRPSLRRPHQATNREAGQCAEPILLSRARRNTHRILRGHSSQSETATPSLPSGKKTKWNRRRLASMFPERSPCPHAPCCAAHAPLPPAAGQREHRSSGPHLESSVSPPAARGRGLLRFRRLHLVAIVHRGISLQVERAFQGIGLVELKTRRDRRCGSAGRHGAIVAAARI